MLHWFTNLSIGKKLITSFLLVGIIPFAVLGYTALDASTKALKHEALMQLETVRGIKSAQIENYFQRRKDDLDMLKDTLERVQKRSDSSVQDRAIGWRD